MERALYYFLLGISPLLIFLLGISIKKLKFYRDLRKHEGIYFNTVNHFYKKYKDSENIKGVHKFISFNSKSYVERESNRILSKFLLETNSKIQGAILLGISMIGKTTMFYNEIFRNKDTLKKHILFIPVDRENLLKWNKKLPPYFLGKNFILFLDDLNRFTLEKNQLQDIVDAFPKRHNLRIVSTCRINKEYESIEAELDEFFEIMIPLEKIGSDQAKHLAIETGKNLKNYDGTPGSIVLAIKRQLNKIKNLYNENIDCYNLLKSSAILYHFLSFNIYSYENIKTFSKQILKSDIKNNDFSKYITELENEWLINIDKGKKTITIADPYLDYFTKEFNNDVKVYLNNIENYAIFENNKEILSRLAGYYNYILGNTACDDKEYNLSLKYYQKAIDLKPDCHEAWYNMGLAYYENGEFDTAIKKYEEAIKIKPDYHEALNNMGISYEKKGEFDKAIEKYEEVIKIKPDYYEAWYNMGLAYYENGEFDTAIKKYEEAIKIKPDYHEAFNNMGKVYIEKKNYKKAKSFLIKHDKIIKKKGIKVPSDIQKFLDDFYKKHK